MVSTQFTRKVPRKVAIADGWADGQLINSRRIDRRFNEQKDALEFARDVAALLIGDPRIVVVVPDMIQVDVGGVPLTADDFTFEDGQPLNPADPVPDPDPIPPDTDPTPTWMGNRPDGLVLIGEGLWTEQGGGTVIGGGWQTKPENREAINGELFLKYPQGLAPGGDATAVGVSHPPVTRLYAAVELTVDPSWVYHGTGTNKDMFFISNGQPGGGNPLFLEHSQLVNNQQGTDLPDGMFRFQGHLQGNGVGIEAMRREDGSFENAAAFLSQGRNGLPVVDSVRGQKYLVEVSIEPVDIGAGWWEYRQWIDGDLVVQDVVVLPGVTGWDYEYLKPMFGGNTGPAPAADMFIIVGRLWIGGA